ncbi:hypothetical protein Zmor_027845 [Zophobas morio]|uniref:Uncharacterized protein n=1 Tax=Zophobas morio TaxID=2755281 RepID=A0AA38M2E8_9CUCU|nr:hypothetical protein Zmor_027845 [Zophobas morio]
MSDEEIFYDSLEEDAFENEESCESSFVPPVTDLNSAVPLYTGEISINLLNPSKTKRVEKPPKRVIQPDKTKKTYLTMYYEKKSRLESKSDTGSNTSRAVCETLSPKRDLDLEADLKEAESRCMESESEQDEFYENFMNLELANKQASSSISVLNNKETKSLSTQSLLPKTTSERSFYFNSTKNDAIEKLELLKKRQTYGMKMSLKNRIEIEELKKLKKIKHSKVV